MILLLLSLLTPARAGELVDGVACVVNDQVITLSDVYDAAGDFIQKRCGTLTPGVATPCSDQAEAEVAESLIMKELVRQKLSEVGMDIDDSELDRTIDQIMRDNGIETREQFRQALSSQGYAWEDYRAQLRDQVRSLRFRETFLRPQVRVTEDELRDAYQRATRDDDPASDVLSITYLLYPLPQGGDAERLTLKAELLEAVAGVQAGEGDFDALDTIAGSEPRKATSTYLPSQLIEELRPILELEVGGVGGPYLIGNSFFIVRLDSRSASQVKPFDEVRAQLEAQLAEERVNEEAEQWFQHARRGASIRCTFEGPEE